MRSLCILATLLLCAIARAQDKPWPIRAVIVTTFEVGNDTGDIPGEFQFWVEREHLDRDPRLPRRRPRPHHPPLRTNTDHTILGMVCGTTLVNATASMMALGLDPRFDLTHAYILINGIAGVDPNVASIGSAAWAKYVVGDVVREIDPREAPKRLALRLLPHPAPRAQPATLTDAPTWHRSNLYTLNPKLVAWAFAQTKDLKLGDDPKVADFRAAFTGFPNAQRPPFVLIGDTFASDYYWHGAIMNPVRRRLGQASGPAARAPSS